MKPPMAQKRMREIHGMSGQRNWNTPISILTQIQPINGIANWKNPKTPAISVIFLFFMYGSCRPFASETEKASMARPAPRRRLLRKSQKLKMIPLSNTNKKDPRARKPYA